MHKVYWGAEAVIYRYQGCLIKERIKKPYRISQIDKKLRVSRTKKEAKLMSDAGRAGVLVPRIIDANTYSLSMDFIDGQKLRDVVEKEPHFMSQLGRAVATLHENNIIHGDITTSNAIVKQDKLYIIDFGLGFISRKAENKAVDIWLLKEVIDSSHNRAETLWELFLKSYKENYRDAAKVIKRLDKIQKRGRYRKR